MRSFVCGWTVGFEAEAPLGALRRQSKLWGCLCLVAIQLRLKFQESVKSTPCPDQIRFKVISITFMRILSGYAQYPKLRSKNWHRSSTTEEECSKYLKLGEFWKSSNPSRRSKMLKFTKRSSVVWKRDGNTRRDVWRGREMIPNELDWSS